MIKYRLERDPKTREVDSIEVYPSGNYVVVTHTTDRQQGRIEIHREDWPWVIARLEEALRG